MSDSEESVPAQTVKRVLPKFMDAESKTEEAKKAFEELSECTYSNKHIGDSGQNEHMTCDCIESWDSDLQQNMACGEESDCINRVTSVECINKFCTCGKNCQNQRFQKKQYAPITVFQTEKKGYGVRSDESISESSFIYEYIGEVIDEKIFRQRMIDYDRKNFKHFYFMMLTKDAFIDATVKGSLARFVNHSCNPNAYVDKWVVGDKLRMGIFAKRHIEQGEEITFDYNVDRYGAQSQPCYCGEPNCIKWMGGKTQTDAALLLPDGISEALGVTHKQEKQWLKENKHRRNIQQSDDSVINEDFVKSIEPTPLQEGDVSKLMGALLKAQDINIIMKLIDRIYLTNDSKINSIIVRFHGYKTLSKLLSTFKDKDDQLKDDLIERILQVLTKWPKVTRNKIESSQIEDVVKSISNNSENSSVLSLSKDLLEEWGKLQMAYRIPKNVNDGKNVSNSPSLYARSTRSNESPSRSGSHEPSATNTDHEDIDEIKQEEIENEEPLPDGWDEAIDPVTNIKYYYHRQLMISKWERPTSAVPKGPKGPNLTKLPKGPKPKTKPPINPRTRRPISRNNSSFNGGNTPMDDESEFSRREEERLKKLKESQFLEIREKEKQLQDFILQSQREVEEKQRLQDKLKNEERERRHKLHQHSHNSKGKTPDKVISVESQWHKVLAKYIPNLIKKHEKEIGRDNIKGCAKELVNILTNKELKRDAKAKPPIEFEGAKLKKLKDFCNEFMDKFLKKYRTKKENKKRSNDEPNGDSTKKIKQ